MSEKITQQQIKQQIRNIGIQCGFSSIGFSSISIPKDELSLIEWLNKNYHGDMHYMEKHGLKRSRPEQLIPGTISVISATLNYLPETPHSYSSILQQSEKAAISRYALGRDYHKLMRKMLARFADQTRQILGDHSHRVFVDSAPVLERALARNAGLGWVGKHTNLINKQQGSWFFIGEIYTNARIEPDDNTKEHCGRCTQCLDICPTNAFTSPYHLDARKCISYLTIEHFGSIPIELRDQIGNRIYGCDDCQMVCPWNRFAKTTTIKDFTPRNNFDAADLSELFSWNEPEFNKKCEGSPIRRIGHQRWLRNIAIALGNASNKQHAQTALTQHIDHPSELVKEHVLWALEKTNKTRA